MYIKIGEFDFHNGKEVSRCQNQFWKRVMKIKLVYEILWCEHLNETPSAQIWHVLQFVSLGIYKTKFGVLEEWSLCFVWGQSKKW